MLLLEESSFYFMKFSWDEHKKDLKKRKLLTLYKTSYNGFLSHKTYRKIAVYDFENLNICLILRLCKADLTKLFILFFKTRKKSNSHKSKNKTNLLDANFTWIMLGVGQSEIIKLHSKKMIKSLKLQGAKIILK